MNVLTTKTDYQVAVEQLQAASAAYYGGQEPLMDDYTYDQLWQQVAEAEAAHPDWVQDAPVTARVAGGAVTGTVAHARPMLSLNNTYDADEIGAWLARVTKETPGAWFVVEPKIDGLALNLTYRDGELVQVTTRGDGTSGEDVSGIDFLISNVPHAGVVWPDGTPFTADLRGEAVFTRDQFDEANRLRAAHGDKPFVNPRNGVAGAVRGGATKPYRMEFLFVCYDAVVADERAGQSYTDLMSRVAKAGFQTSTQMCEFEPLPAGQVGASVARFEQERRQLNVDTDGAVVKVDSFADRDRLGTTGHAPRWAVAFKFPPDEVMSVLEEVIWQVGRTGVITPRARITPTFVGGTTIEYATLHNPADIERKGFLLGDTVLVKRAGEVIPRLEAPVTSVRTGREKPIVPPAVCPRCGGALDRTQERWRCERGRQCGLAEAIAYAVSRDALDIEGLGKVQVANLTRSGAVTSVAHLFGLSEQALIDFGKVAPANAPKIVAQIDKARSADLSRVLTALGVRGTGRSLSRRIARKFGTLDAVAAATVDELAEVDGVGTEKSALIREELDELRNVIIALLAMNVGLRPYEPATITPGGSPAGTYSSDNLTPPLAGQTVVVTGSMVGPLAGKSRNDVNEMIESLGGKSSGSVSKNTHLLVVGQNAGA